MNKVRFATLSRLALLLFGGGSGAQGQTTSKSPEQDSQPIDLSNFYGKVAGTEGDNWFYPVKPLV